ncbi:ABC-2 type transporter domain-containing protein [Phthorimaea operculella]|nr:ABC-2 type transporter domain-containing protein [Phthorimaea operculella]
MKRLSSASEVLTDPPLMFCDEPTSGLDSFMAQNVIQVRKTSLSWSECQNTVIGIPGRLKGTSGGDMKRQSFASEVLTDPPLMFCDEPTSGLDSFMAQNVIQVRKTSLSWPITAIGIPGRLKGISGGEMKRLSFASEVLTDPPLMFCDEPTSGLDSFMAQNVIQVRKTSLSLSKCQDTVIGIPGRLKDISGDEMKHLSFASEVLTDPPLMFCDDPASGLAQNVIQVLKGLAQKGKTVICTIHQPSSELYAMFDKLLIMADGRVAFLGSPDQATDFFKELGAACPANYNPADHFIQLLAGVPGREEATRHTVDTVCTSFAKSELGCRIAAEAENALFQERKISSGWADAAWSNVAAMRARRSPYKASWCAQFRAVLWRSWLSVTKEPMLIKVRFLQTIMVSILIGVIYFGQHLDQDGVMNINGAIFMFLTNMTFQNIFAVINVFCSELPIFIREHHSGMYRADVYFLSKTLAEAPVFATIPLVFTTIAYYMIGLNPAPERFFIASGLAALITNVATSFGYLISCASSSVSMAASVGPPIIIPFMLFGGFFLNSGSIPPYLSWISYLSWFRYGNEALLINQWTGVDSIACTRENFTCPASGQVVLETLSFSEWTGVDSIACTRENFTCPASGQVVLCSASQSVRAGRAGDAQLLRGEATLTPVIPLDGSGLHRLYERELHLPSVRAGRAGDAQLLRGEATLTPVIQWTGVDSIACTRENFTCPASGQVVLETLSFSEWTGVDSIACTRENFTCPASGQVVLETLSFSEDDFTFDVVNMVLLFVGFRLLAYLALLWRTRRGK